MNVDYRQQIIKYVAEHNPVLCVMTPCYGGMVHTNYTISLINTIRTFDEFKIPIIVEFCKNDSLVQRARNNLVAKSMSHANCTHFMFIDADITWTPLDVLKLILANKPIVGGAYPLKHYFYDKLLIENGINVLADKKANNPYIDKSMTNEEYLRYNLVKHNLNYKSPQTEIKNNLAEVKHLATGFLMIQRKTFIDMMLFYKQTKYVDDVCYLEPDENKYAFALFDCIIVDGHYLSEDWTFCHRWTSMSPSNSIHVDVSINLTHTGVEDYCGNFLASMT